MANNQFAAAAKKQVAANIKKMTVAVTVTVIAIAVCMVALTVALILDVLSLNIDYTLEAGDELPGAIALSGYSDAVYDFGNGDGDFSVPGEYEIYIIHKSRRITVHLTVEDTTAPKGQLLALKVNKDGPFPSAKDFFAEIKDASEVTAKFLNAVNPSELKEYEVQIELSDPYGNAKKYQTTMTLIEDTEAPVIAAPKSITGYVGEAVAYRKDVTVTDNCFGFDPDTDLAVDSSAVDNTKVGSYKAIYTATDRAGNTASCEVTVNIYAEKIGVDRLMDKIGTLSGTLGITKSMSKEEQVKRIYEYVNSPALSASTANIRFINESNTDRSDWVLEAYRTLETGSGDCYSYFAVSKAFFEYFGIENVDIQRSEGVTTQSGTHFWSMVNIGSEKSPRWYYYDATRLAKKHKTGSGCLFTEAQLVDYNTKVNEGFLTFDHSGYPAASEVTINNNYGW